MKKKVPISFTYRHFLLVFVMFYDMQLVTPRDAAMAGRPIRITAEPARAEVVPARAETEPTAAAIT